MTYQLLLNTCPDQQSAEKIARILIEKKLAACVNILPGLCSVYPWKDQIETAQEHLLIIKTRKDQYHNVETNILSNHPYELPEIIAVSIDQGLPEYLQWIDSCLSVK
jgi:periplasmic divalent cation tolerance protein